MSNAASDKQIAFIDSLLDTREVPQAWVDRVDTLKGLGIDKVKASEIITALKDLNVKLKPVTVTETVPSGRYAIQFADSVKFYKVDNVTEGKWAGRTFVKHIAGEDEHAVRNQSQRASVLKAIAVDPEHASKLYGREIGSCGVCGRQLTDQASREVGIGPVCREKQGW